jgi:hypothetical protein
VGCIFANDCVEGETCVGGYCQLLPPTCPQLTPSFQAINDGLFQVGCGAKSNACHSTVATTPPLGLNGLDLQKDPYLALLGPDGKGQPVDPNDARPKGLLRVAPGDSLHSMLVIKLKLKGDSPVYGSSMPFDNPGAICDDTIKVIAQWIDAGAQKN